MGFWSKYSLCEADFHPQVDPSTISYHHLHIIQLQLLHRLTNNDIFKKYADIWENNVNTINITKMYLKKFLALKKMNRL